MKIKRFLTALIMLVTVIALPSCSFAAMGDELQDTTATEEGSVTETPLTGNQPADSLEEPQPEPKAVYIKAIIPGVNVRTSPSSSSASLGTLDAADMTCYLGEEDKWYKTYYRGKTAYVSKLYSTLYEMDLAGETVEKVILEGAKLLGTPYVFGAVRLHDGDGIINKGFNINKFDCSSYMQYIYFYGAGIILDTVTRTQIKQGKYVEREDMRRGDLIFFTNSSRYYNTGIERVGHVALYLGNEYILHTASDHAVIEKISATRSKYYIETRRII